MKRFFWSYQGFDIVMLAGTVLVAALLTLCSYAHRPGHFGLPPALVPIARASLIPVLLASGIGLQRAGMAMLGFERKPLIPITNKAGGIFNYFIGGAGIIFACVALIVASTASLPDDGARNLLQAAAAFWGLTVGTLFDAYFKRYVPSEGVAAASARPAATADAAATQPPAT